MQFLIRQSWRSANGTLTRAATHKRAAKEGLPWLDIIYLVVGLAFFALMAALRRRLRPAVKGATTHDRAMIGLAVGALLAVYLLYTLIHPEKF